ncbi:MFS transporter [Roseococcus sp. DSY-14]|uniref:MFS transporter n=1 Tax=Roseococcus sp. DSY-14 TaxID=3369650 RepID=UPI00387AB68F
MPSTRATAAIVASALFMQNLDSSAVVTALPAMARDLGEDPARLGVAITAYLVALTVFIPLSGFIADRFGAKRVFLLAIAIFGASSALCGLSDGLGELVLWRVAQGLGGAMMVPVGRLLLLSSIRKEEMLTAMTWLTMPAMLGPISGPPLGGLLTDLLGWRSVFFINVPVALLGLALVAWKIPPSERRDPGPPDIKGLLLLGGALAAFMAGLETVGRGVLPPWWPEALLLAGLALGALALRHLRRASRPALELALLREPGFRAATLAGSLFRTGAGAVPFLVPMLLQVGFGWGATESGFVTFATALGAFAMKPLARPLLRRLGFRTALAANTVLAALGVAAGALFTPAWPVAAMFAVLALGGLSRSLNFTALNTLAFADLPKEKLSAGTGFYGMAQQMPGAVAVVLATASLEAARHWRGGAALAPADFTAAFVAAALVVLCAVPGFLALPRGAGAAVSGHRPRGVSPS